MSWQTVYFHYDEDALTVFANAGLLRRAKKDVDNEKVSLTDPNTGQFSSDGQNVVLHEAGIQQASCDCSASGCCKHILAAVLWLQANNVDHSNSDNSIETSAETINESVEITPLLPTLFTLDPELLIKKAGKPACRTAIKLIEQWENITFNLEDTGTQLKIQLPDVNEPVIFLQASGYDGMLSPFSDSQKKAFHLAIVAKLFEQHSKPWTWPENLIAVQSSKRPLNDEEIALIKTIELFIYDLLRQGLSHISLSSATQLHLLNMSARAEGLPRLASYLRTLSTQVKLLAERHFTMDESRVLRLLAHISAYLFQLSNATPEQLKVLRGQLRRQYDDKKKSLSLIPIGANWWTAQSGALGATFTFWDSEEKQLLQATQARPNQLDTLFNRYGVWNSLSLWKQTADKLMRRPFLLQEPRISDEGKLATIGDSFAQNQADFLGITNYNNLQTELGINNWQDLPDYFAHQTEGFLSPLVLHIKNYKPLIWYEVEQCVIWEVSDNHENSAFLRLYWEGTTQNNLEELRFITKKELEIVAITVQPVRRDLNIDLLPTTIWINTEKGIELFYLDFDQFPHKKKQSGFISRIQEYMAKRKQQTAMHHSEPTLAQKFCRPILSVLEAQACTGRELLSEMQKEQLEISKHTADDLGMTLIADQLAYYLTLTSRDSRALLQLIWLCDNLQQLQSPLPIQFNE
ncbi:SWIM zinc finger family protein [Proteus sp. fly-1008]|uniref:SWIM zinc finger family protein n=1 Tax=Proteus sp. fly-1008 TaxID=3136672 RepID=UPI0032DAB9E0